MENDLLIQAAAAAIISGLHLKPTQKEEIPYSSYISQV